MIIGLCGFAGSGKGTVADILADQHFKKLSFADTLKDATAVLFDWPRKLLEGDTPESREFRETKDEFWSKKFGKDFTPRMALQLMGTEAGRDVFHKDIWIHTTEKQMSKYARVVIADVRFQNEIKFIQNSGGFVVRVKRGPEPEWYNTAHKQNMFMQALGVESLDYPEKDFMKNLYPNVHISEWAWIGTNFDFLIENDGGIEDLESKVNYMLRLFKMCDTI